MAVSVGRTYAAPRYTAPWRISCTCVDLKHRVPTAMPRNRIWALGLTGIADLNGHRHMVLGLLDHSTRACLRVSARTDKRNVTILRELIEIFSRG